jgi:tetratricopeptide (TPR) repeat protein
VPAFAGRAEQLRRLTGLLADADRGPAVVITAISGTAGIGKTALAVHWAHQVADRFPDGQLYVNLRGFDPTGSVLPPGEAVRGLLDALGVPAERVPAGLDAQAALYRSLLAGRQLLVLLDNARDADQVRPLLPGTPGCLVVVTSRDQLTGLVAAVGAQLVPVDQLSTVEARELLAGRLGRSRVVAEPAAVEEILACCARLPLALAVVAARAAANPAFPLARLAAELQAARGGLDALSGSDPATDVRAVFSWSYRALSAGAARLFRLLGLHPGPDISVPAAASLAGLPLPDARGLLAELAGGHLIVQHAPGRYSFHDLLGAYAAEQARAFDPDGERQAAVRRALDHYLHTAHAAAQILNPYRGTITLSAPEPGVTPGACADHSAALAWYAAERPVLLAAIDQASRAGLDSHTWQLAWSVAIFLERQGHWHEQAASQRAGLAAAQRLGDRAGQVYAHCALARGHLWLGEEGAAVAHLGAALDLLTELGDAADQASVHLDLSLACGRQGRDADALDHARQALDGFQASGDRVGQAGALNSIGWYEAQLGNYRPALASCRQALTLHQETGDKPGEAATWDSLGYVENCLGHGRQALLCYQQAVRLYRSLGDRYEEATTLTYLGDTQRLVDDAEAARRSWRQAVDILDGLGHPDAAGVRTRLASAGSAARSAAGSTGR